MGGVKVAARTINSRNKGVTCEVCGWGIKSALANGCTNTLRAATSVSISKRCGVCGGNQTA